MFRRAAHWLLLCGSVCGAVFPFVLSCFVLAGQVQARTCDLDGDGDGDGDGDVDLDDITLLQRSLPSRPVVTGPDDPRDANHDGRIDILDVRTCILCCTRAKCSSINQAPFANAGPDQSVKVGAQVLLSGAGSSDPDGDPLRYTWTLNIRPIGSVASLVEAATVAPRFTADKPGSYLAQWERGCNMMTYKCPLI